MHKTSRLLACALLILGLAHPTFGQPRVTLSRNAVRRDLIGCYALYFERGRVDGSLFNASSSVRLDSMPWEYMKRDVRSPWRSMIGFSLAGRLAPLRAGGLFPSSWTADSLTDSVRLSFVDGFSGAVFVLNAPAGRTDSLYGRVFESWDAGPPFFTPRGRASAVREACPP
jgi:hypothetical protein